MLVAAKATYIVLVAFCGLASGDCGLAVLHPLKTPTYKNLAACKVAADKLRPDVPEQTKLLSHSQIPGPWTVEIACGTQKDFDTLTNYLRGRQAVRNLQAEHPEEEDRPEAPGDRDPYPDGG